MPPSATRPGFCVIVRGPLGVGKTTVARAVAARLGGAYLSVDEVLESHHLEEWDEDRISLDSFLRANAVIVGRARPLLERRLPVVVDGNFYWTEQIEDLVKRLPAPVRVVTLAAPVATCVERDRQRPPPDPKRGPRAGDSMGPEAVADVYRLVAAVPSGTTVGASGSVRRTVDRICRLLRAEGLS